MKTSSEVGSAIVECALLLLILIPIFLYMAFSGEAGLILLETQEQMISTIWDFSVYPYNMEKSPQWLTYDGKTHEKQDQISAHNRLQYADMDSSFTNEARFIGNSMDMRTDYFSTLAFVQPTHCDGDCQNFRHDYEDQKVHEVVCGMEDRDIGGFLEGKLPLSSTGMLQKKSKGGLIICQEKARLKNYLLMKSFLPEFISADLWSGDKYKAGKRIIDNRSQYKDVVVRHRGVLLTDSWALTDSPRDHRDTNSISLLNYEASASSFHSLTNDVLNGSLLAIPTLPAVGYMQDAMSKNLSIPLALPLGGLSSMTNTPSISKALDFLTNLGGLAGLPNIMGLSLVANYSHDGKKLNDYKYTQLGDTGDALFTTPLFGEYEKAWDNRGVYYMGSPEQAGKA
jgi:hypothetical protein